MTLVDNVTLRHAVAGFAADPGQRRAFDVLRECMYGELLLDVTGSGSPVAGNFPEGTAADPIWNRTRRQTCTVRLHQQRGSDPHASAGHPHSVDGDAG